MKKFYRIMRNDEYLTYFERQEKTQEGKTEGYHTGFSVFYEDAMKVGSMEQAVRIVEMLREPGDTWRIMQVNWEGQRGAKVWQRATPGSRTEMDGSIPMRIGMKC